MNSNSRATEGMGPVTVITGAASGIGRKLVGTLAGRHHLIIAADVDVDRLEAEADIGRWPPQTVVRRRLDVRDADDWEQLVASAVGRWGRLDYLLNVAGYLRPGHSHEQPVEEIDRHVDVNVKGVMLGTRAAARQMVRQGGGQIINVASLAGVAPVPGLSLYSATKFAVRGFSLAVAAELEPHGVAVTVLCPDAVDTPMLELQVRAPEAALTFSGSEPLTVDEVASAVLTIIERRPREVLLPFSRGALALLAGTLPRLATLLHPLLERLGRRKQAALLDTDDI